MPRESLAERKKRAARIDRRLKRMYPAKTALTHSNPFELLAATILSAQCTDVRVNEVLPHLFARYNTPEAMAHADRDELEAIIRPTGFFRSKAKSLMALSRDLLDKYGGEVPDSMEELLTLRGVGRKTANVVLGSAFGIATGVVVDTHVGRLSRRMRFTRHTDPAKVERDLMQIISETDWIGFSHRMIWHGRALCLARRPKCEDCPLVPDCPTAADYLPVDVPLRRTQSRASHRTRSRKRASTR
ncbi:MAG: endonuclease III [candidate division Zixibacteria bacterium]|nr:endonuclease III [candidate division Zixibacteria bacterium]